jgi:hypothetical protein
MEMPVCEKNRSFKKKYILKDLINESCRDIPNQRDL